MENRNLWEALPEGHPIRLMELENEVLEALLPEFVAEDEATQIEALEEMDILHSHYAKTEQLFMTGLYSYGVTGPGEVIWKETDRIKRKLSFLGKEVGEEEEISPLYQASLQALAESIKAMMVKERQIIYPMSLRFFTEEDWLKIYRDMKEMGLCLPENYPRWQAGEEWAGQEAARLHEAAMQEGRVQLPAGELTFAQLRAILSLLPVDLTFIDSEDKVRFFVNEGKVFPRPFSALSRDVADCHPPYVVPAVKKLIADFREKKRTSLEVARQIHGQPVLVRYLGVYDEEGEYLGTLEVVQACGEILEKFS